MSNRCSAMVWERDFGSMTRKLLAARLADHADDEGRGIWPSVERLSAECNASRSTIQRTLKDFVEEGLLIIVEKGGRGPKDSTRYDFDMDALRAVSLVEWGHKKGVTVTPLEENKGVTEEAEGCHPAQKGCHGDTQTTIEPPVEPSSEREAHARARSGDREEGETGEDAPEDRPGTAAFAKRVMRLCAGRGYLAGPWKDWDTASPEWIGGRFAALSPQERAEAERWRDAYLLDVKDRGKDPAPIGVWLKGRTWTGLDPAILERAEKRRQAQLTPDEQAKPDGWAPMLGPVGMARLFALLIDGPPEGTPPADGLWLDAQLRRDWPAVHQWKQVQHMKGGVVFGERWHALKDAMEPVPRDSEVLAAWKAEFQARGWPWLTAFDGPKVVYCPKGGPEGLEAFGRAVQDEGANGQASEAAE